MAELLLKTTKRYSATCSSRFSVSEICAIVSDMSTVADKNKAAPDVSTVSSATPVVIQQEKIQSESQRLNDKLRNLLRKISDKDKSAFEHFYDQTIILCFSQALRIAKRDDIAEEIVSDVYMQVWNKASSYDKKRSGVMTWLMMLCRSRALDALRKRKNQQTKESVSIDSIAEPFTDDNPQDIVNATQQGSLLHSAILQLKPQQRQLLSLAYFKGLTHKEISNYTELPLGTVKTQIRRAIIMLKKLISKQEIVCSSSRGDLT